MSWGLFIGGIMAGFVAAWIIAEKAKYDIMEYEWEEKEMAAREINVYEPVVVPTMTDEEYEARMNRLFEIFTVKE